MTKKMGAFFVLAVFLAVGVGAYYNVLDHGGFVMDDHDYLIHNPTIKNMGVSLRDIWELRYIGYLTFAANYAISGLTPRAFHYTNFAIHLINALLAFVLTRALWRFASDPEPSDDSESTSYWVSFAVGLLFLIHPIQTTAGAYISQRFSSLSAFFYMSACYSYLLFRHAREKGRPFALQCLHYFVSLVLTLLAVKTKEISFTIPAMLFLIELVCGNKSRFGWRRYIYAFPHVALATIIPISIFAQEYGLISHQGHLSWMLMAKKDDLLGLSRYVYFINQLRIVTHYLQLLVFPVGQRAQYDFLATGNLFHPGVLFGGAVLSLFAAFGVRWYRRYRAAEGADRPLYMLACLGVGWFFVAMSVESSVIPIKHLVFEHRVYLPAYGFFLTAAALGALLAKRLPDTYRLRVILAVSMFVVASLTVTTYLRNRIWADAVLLWTDVVEKSPGLLAGWHNRAVEYRMKGRYDLAIADLDRAVAHVQRNVRQRDAWPDPDLNPENASKVHGMRAKVALALGDYGKAKADFSSTVQNYDAAKNKEFVFTVLSDIANDFFGAGLLPDAIDLYAILIEKVPSDPGLVLSRGRVYLQAEFFGDALKDFDRALASNEDPQAYFYRSMAHAGLGDQAKARQDLTRACDLGFGPACNQIGRPAPAPRPAAPRRLPPNHPGVPGNG